MADRYLVIDTHGRVTNIIVGFVPMLDRGMILQTADLEHVGISWRYDSETDAFRPPEDVFELVLDWPDFDLEQRGVDQ